MSTSPGAMNPLSKPFDAYMRDTHAVPFGPEAVIAHEIVAMSKRILLQQNVRDFTAADVLVLAGLIRSLRP